TVHPERSTASVADGLASSMYSAASPPAGWYWISLITTFGSADCEAGTGLPAPVLSAITLRRSARPSTRRLRASAGVRPPHALMSRFQSAVYGWVIVSHWFSNLGAGRKRS